MPQRTGSVYLDAPLPRSRRPPVPRVSRTRATVATACAVAGLLALGVAGLVWGVQALVLDADPIADALETTLDNPRARAELEGEIAEGIESGLVGEELTLVAAAFDLDVAEEAHEVAADILDDVAVREELRALLRDVHSRVLVEARTSRLDLTPLTTAVLAVIERESPRLASIVPADATLWQIDADTLPDLTGPMDLADRVRLAAVAAGLLLLPLGAIVHPRRHLVASWAGRSALVAGLVCALAAVGLPYLVGSTTGWAAAEIVVRSTSLRLLAPAGIIGIGGMGLVSLSAVARGREERKVLEEGAAAAFGYDEPPLWQQRGNPTLDLAARGLVDVNHPLTNI